jgi:hypothetical protein
MTCVRLYDWTLPEIANAASLHVGFESDLELDAAFATVDSDSDSDGTDDD